MAYKTVYLTQLIDNQPTVVPTSRAELTLIDRKGETVETFYSRTAHIPNEVFFSPDGGDKRRYVRDTDSHSFYEAK